MPSVNKIFSDFRLGAYQPMRSKTRTEEVGGGGFAHLNVWAVHRWFLDFLQFYRLSRTDRNTVAAIARLADRLCSQLDRS